ncbi:MAG TPA: TIGR02281 family clan AA aspartic protease [Methylibium sp.]
MRALLCGALLAAAAPVFAQSVALSGSMGNKALLVIDGGAPRALAPGESAQGVKLVSVSGGMAVIEVAGQRQSLVLGGAPVSVGGKGTSGGGGTKIVLSAGPGGHFVAGGSINGRAVQFLVDTGATMVAMSFADAQRIGLKYEGGQRVGINTANGQAIGYRVSLDSVRVNDVTVYNVDAVVQPADMPVVLLGNSFLGRFQMKRENDVLTLDKRY